MRYCNSLLGSHVKNHESTPGCGKTVGGFQHGNSETEKRFKVWSYVHVDVLI